MYTSHGHQIPGTPVEGERPPVRRCWGIGRCSSCSKEAGREFIKTLNPIEEKNEKKMEAVDEAIEVLNRIHKKDPSVLPALIFHRVPCNVELARDRTVQVGRAKSESGHAWEVGLLGIINGLFGVDAHGWGHIYANFEEHRLVNFSRKPEPHNEVG